MANIKLRDLPLYSEADSNRSEEWLMVAQSGAQNGRKTVRMSLDEVAPIDDLSGLIKNNRDNINVLSGNLNTVSGNVDTVENNLFLTGQTLSAAAQSETLAFSTGLNPNNSSESGYFVNDRYRPNLTLVRGRKYKITANLPDAPVWFTKTPNGGGSVLSYEIARPEAENGDETAWGGPLMFFTVPEDMPSNVFYQSYQHSNFGGKIHFTNGLLFDSDKDTSITLDNTGVSDYETNTITMKASGEKVLCLTSTEAKIEKPFFVNGSGDISGDLRVQGDLTVNGGYTQIDTNVQTTEQMSVTNDGTGPAIIANQKGTQPVVDFRQNSQSVFFVDNGGYIGINNTAPNTILDIDGVDAIQLPAGDSSQRPSLGILNLSGMIRFNTESGIYEGYSESEWKELGGGGGQTMDEDEDTYITPEETPDCDSLDFYTAGVKRAQISTAGDTLLAGDLLCSGDIVAFYSTSDQSLKENISTINNPIEKINQIKGVEFDWKENESLHNTGHDVGVIAQQVEQVIPEAVLTRKNGIKSVEYHKIIPLLIECIHNQEERIKELEKKCQYKA